MQYSGNKNSVDKVLEHFRLLYSSENEPALYFSPGRIEIGGNHTDHNNGRILAASINYGTTAAVLPNNRNEINLFSLNFKAGWKIDLEALEINVLEKGEPPSLIRGIAAALKKKGFNIGGFNCVLESSIGIGSGLSSSASFEMLIAIIMNDLFNANKITIEDLAKAGQSAENLYFGKPCGLMDQLAVAAGGIISVDFFDPVTPVVNKIPFDFNAAGFSIIIINTGGSHSSLTNEYSSIPEEMKRVAAFFNKDTLRSLRRSDIINNLNQIRSAVGDRAVLRALHYLSENERVAGMVTALKKRNVRKFMKLVNKSGLSSALWLQNLYSIKNPIEQNLNIALELTINYLKEHKSSGAARVHGGGFAGTIITFVEHLYAPPYMEMMDNLFADKSIKIEIVQNGAGRV